MVLGARYKFGRGVPQDYAEAVPWHRLAAEQGEASAQFNLALMYTNGEGDYEVRNTRYTHPSDHPNM